MMNYEDRELNNQVNVWDYKPWWCQPWSIILTGLTMIAGSWFLLRLWWVSGLIAIPIIVWWVYFLVLYPRAIANAYSQRD